MYEDHAPYCQFNILRPGNAWLEAARVSAHLALLSVKADSSSGGKCLCEVFTNIGQTWLDGLASRSILSETNA